MVCCIPYRYVLVSADLIFMTRLLSTRSLLLFVAILAFWGVTWPVWQWLWGEWMGNDYYSHGILIPPVALFLAIQRLRLQNKAAVKRQVLRQPVPPLGGWPVNAHANYALLLLVLSLGAFLFFLNNRAYYLAAFMMLGMIAGLVWTFGGTNLLRQWLFPIGYLALMIPLPFIERMTLPMAIFAGLCAGGLVHFLGMDITIVGSAVTLPNAELVIGAQCSGINSLIALTALMVLAAYLLEGSTVGRIGLVLCALPLALLGNILRIASLLFVARSLGGEAAFIFYHDYSGLVFFFLVFLLMVPLTRLLQVNRLRLDVI